MGVASNGTFLEILLYQRHCLFYNFTVMIFVTSAKEVCFIAISLSKMCGQIAMKFGGMIEL